MSKYLVVATPRSATAYTAQALTDLGLDCGHERHFGLETQLQAFLEAPGTLGESSWLAVPFLDQLPPDVRVLHQTRDPLKVIRSLLEIQFLDLDADGQPRRVGVRRSFTEFALRHCPEALAYPTELERAAWFYYHWNRRIEAHGNRREILRFRIEDLDERLLRKLLAFIGTDSAAWPDSRLAARLAAVPEDANTKAHEKVVLAEEVTWARLPPEVRELARSYGYAVEDAPVPAAGSGIEGEAYRSAIAALKEESNSLRRLVRDVQTLLNAAQYDARRAQREGRAARKELVARHRQRIEALRSRLQHSLVRVRELRAADHDLRRQLSASNRERERLEGILTDERAHAAELTERLEEAREQIGAQEGTIRELHAVLATERDRYHRTGARAQRLEQRAQFLSAELDRRAQEVRYRLGDALVKAARPSVDTLRLPGRLVRLFLEGLRRQRARHEQGLPDAPPFSPPPAAVPGVPPAAQPTEPPKRKRVKLFGQRRRETTDGRAPGYLFFCVNGAGLGHVTRSLAIARRIRRIQPSAAVYFLSSSQALDVISREGIVAYHIPPYARYGESLRTSEWSDLLRQQIQLIVDTHHPSVFVYDGVYPYRGVLDAIAECRFVHAAMVLRLRHKHDRLAQMAQDLTVFSQLIFPGEAGATGGIAELVPPELAALNCHLVDPIIYLDREELLPRAQVRERWGVPADKKLVYVQLGAGNINDLQAQLAQILAVLTTRPDVVTLLAESPIAERAFGRRDNVHIIRNYPNSLYSNGFDLAITAVGYNTFHEQIHFGVPSILLPNQDTKTDDQVTRAMAAHRAQAAIAVLQPDALADAIALGLTDEVATTLREKSRALVPVNGALAAAQCLIEAAQSAPACTPA
jgi:UDP:flavonoid glycosyltransferase YjiC (YdhE family)